MDKIRIRFNPQFGGVNIAMADEGDDIIDVPELILDDAREVKAKLDDICIALSALPFGDPRRRELITELQLAETREGSRLNRILSRAKLY